MTKQEAILRAWQLGIKRHALLKHPSDGGKVRVMSTADGYAMLRRPGCTPFVRPLTEVVEWDLFTGGDAP